MNIKKERNSLRVSQYKLAKISGVGRFKISLIELGYAEPSLEEIKKIQTAFDKLTKERKNVRTNK